MVSSIGVPEIRMSAHVDPHASEDDVDDARCAYVSNAVRAAYRRIGDLIR